jgi:hypothetical protein
MSTAANPEVNHWRWISDVSGSDHEAWPFAAAEDTNITGELDVGFALVIKVANLGDMNASQAFSLQYNVDGAGWNFVTESDGTPTPNVTSFNSGAADNDQGVAERLTASGRDFFTTYLDEVNGVIGSLNFANEDVELYYSFEFLSADLTAGGEVIEFRLLYGNAPNQETFTHNVGPITATMDPNRISKLPSATLTLTTFAPTVIGDFDPNHISELPFETLILTNAPTDFNNVFRPRGPVTVYGEDGEIAFIDADHGGSPGGEQITVDPLDWDFAQGKGGAAIQEGDLIVLHINAISVGAQAVSDDNGSTPFTNQFRSENPGSSLCEYTIWTRIVGASEPSTYSFLKTNITPSHEVHVRVYRNVDSTIFDIAPLIGNADFGLDTTQINDLTAPGITTTDADSMAVAWVQNRRNTGDQNGGLTYTAGWNLGRSVAENDIQLSVTFEKRMASAGATGDFVVTATNTVTNTWLAVQYALKKSTGDPNTSQLPSDTLALDDFDPQAVATEKHISLLPSDTLILADFDPTIETFDPNTSELSSDVLALADFDPQVVATDNHFSQLAQAAMVLVAFAPQAITTENNVSQLEPETLVIADFDPQSVTTEHNFSELPSVTLVLDEFDPLIIVAASNFSQLPSDALSLADFDPQAVTTEKHISLLPSDTLALADFDPQAITTEKHISLLPSDVLVLADFDPQAVTTEGANNTSELPFDTLTLADFDPQAVTTEKHISELPSDVLTLADFDPQAVTTEGANNFVDLPFDTLSLDDFDPQAVTTEKHISLLPSDTLALGDFDPQAITTEKHISLLPSDVLTLGDFDPTVVATDNNFSQLPFDTLALDDFGPQAVTTENNFSELPFDTLALDDFDPQAITSDNDVSLLPSGTLALDDFDLQAITTEKNVSQLPSGVLVLADFDPTVVSTGGQDVLLPSDALALADFDPQIVTTEVAVPNTSQIGAGILSVIGFAPVANVSDPNVSQLPFDTLSLADFDPQITTTEVANPNTSQLPVQTLLLTDYDIQAFVSGTDQNDVLLPVANLSLSANAPQVAASRRILIIT